MTSATTRWAATVLGVVILATGCTSDDDDSAAEVGAEVADVGDELAATDVEAAGSAAVELLDDYGAQEWPAIYERMHPAQQAIVTQDQFQRCGVDDELAQGLGVVDSIRVLGTEPGETTIAGTDLVEPAVQVSLQLDDSPSPTEVTMVYTGGAWRWTAGDVDVGAMLAC